MGRAAQTLTVMAAPAKAGVNCGGHPRQASKCVMFQVNSRWNFEVRYSGVIRFFWSNTVSDEQPKKVVEPKPDVVPAPPDWSAQKDLKKPLHTR